MSNTDDTAPELDESEIQWIWQPDELDLSEEATDVETAVSLYNGDVVTLNEARARLGMDAMPERSEWGDKLHIEIKAKLLPQSGGTGGMFGHPLDVMPQNEHAAALNDLKQAIQSHLHGETSTA